MFDNNFQDSHTYKYIDENDRLAFSTDSVWERINIAHILTESWYNRSSSWVELPRNDASEL